MLIKVSYNSSLLSMLLSKTGTQFSGAWSAIAMICFNLFGEFARKFDVDWLHKRGFVLIKLALTFSLRTLYDLANCYF